MPPAGARLPSGINNVVARFRTGNGALGPTKTSTKPTAGSRLDRLDKLALAGEVHGGAAPEDGDKARIAAPGKLQSLDRLVSLRDYESEALQKHAAESAGNAGTTNLGALLKAKLDNKNSAQ